MMQKISFFNNLAIILLFSFIITNFIPGNLRNIFFISLFSLALFSLKKKDYVLSNLESGILKPYAYVFLVTLFFIFYHESEIHYFDIFSRFVLVLPLFFLFRKYSINKNIFISLLILLAGLIFILSLNLYLDRDINSERIKGFSSVSITYGNMVMTVFIYLLVALLERSTTKRKLIISFAMLLAGISWSFTLTKGSLIGLFIVFGYILFSNSFIKHKTVIFALAISFFTIILLSPANKAINRFISDINYFSTTNIDDIHKNPAISFSTKERVFLLINSKDMILEYPLTGIGYQNFKKHIVQQTKKVNRKYGMAHHDHAHNDFIDLWAKIGILGLLVLIYFYVVHIKYFHKSINKNKSNFFGKIGMVTLLSQLGFMLTQTQLTHHQPTLFFLVFLMVCISQTVQKESSAITKHE
jgi:O-antigen ligase